MNQFARVTCIKIPVWVRRGVMIVNRDCLDGDDPDHRYHVAARVLAPFGQTPEEFGLTNPSRVFCRVCGARLDEDCDEGLHG